MRRRPWTQGSYLLHSSGLEYKWLWNRELEGTSTCKLCCLCVKRQHSYESRKRKTTTEFYSPLLDRVPRTKNRTPVLTDRGTATQRWSNHTERYGYETGFGNCGTKSDILEVIITETSVNIRLHDAKSQKTATFRSNYAIYMAYGQV